MIKNFMLLPDELNEKEREDLQSMLYSIELYIGVYQFYDIGEFRYKVSVVRTEDILGNDTANIRIFVAKLNSEKIILTYTFDREFFIEEIGTYLQDLASNSIETGLSKFIYSLNALTDVYNSINYNGTHAAYIRNVNDLIDKYNLQKLFKVQLFHGDDEIIRIAIIPLNEAATAIGKKYSEKIGVEKNGK